MYCNIAIVDAITQCERVITYSHALICEDVSGIALILAVGKCFKSVPMTSQKGPIIKEMHPVGHTT